MSHTNDAGTTSDRIMSLRMRRERSDRIVSHTNDAGTTSDRIMRILTVLLMLFILPSVAAIGISPAQIAIGPEDTAFTFRPITDTAVQARAEGDLAQYITLEKTLIQPGEEIRGSIALPADITPGPHQQYILISTAASAGGTVGAAAEVAGSLLVKIPYPQEYLEADWEITRDEGTGTAHITITMENLGSVAVTPDITISADEEHAVAAPSVQPGTFAQAQATYTPRVPGVQEMTLSVSYAGRTITKSTTQSFGLPRITITDLIYNDEAGSIKPVDISGTTGWNQPLNATISIYLDNDTMPVQSDSVLLSPAYTHRIYIEPASEPAAVTAIITAGAVTAMKTTTMQAENNTPLWPLLLGLATLVLIAIILWYRKPPKINTVQESHTETLIK